MYLAIRFLQCFVLIWIDLYYFLWAYTLRYSLPHGASDMVVSTLRGNIGQAKNFLLKELTRNVQDLKAEGTEPLAIIKE